jgi:hypothetical protein
MIQIGLIDAIGITHTRVSKITEAYAKGESHGDGFK